MKKYKNPELINAYTVILSLALLLHIVFTAVFFIIHLPVMAWYNIGITCFYCFLLVLIHLEYYRLTVTLTHMEVCMFVVVSTLCIGWDTWHCVYLISLSALVFFNPYEHKKIIYAFPVLEIILFLSLRVLMLNVSPLIPLDDRWNPLFFFINCVSCFGIIITGTIVSKVTLDTVKRIRDRMAYDKTTGVYSREYFTEKVENILEKTSETEYCLILTNILGFKYFNELFGKDKGDEVLKVHAQILKNSTELEAIYGRVSGNEFGILLERSKFREDQLKELITRVEEQFTSNLYLMRIRVGIYIIKNSSESIDTMLDKAKMAIDSIREEYNICFAYYNDRILEKSLYEKQLLGEFEQALEHNQFCFYLQPQMTQHNNCLGAEALVRWKHPHRGLITPGDFLPVLEDTGLIWKLDTYIWECVAEKLKQWETCAKTDMYISINISPRDFYYLDIFKVLTSLVEKYQIDPSRLKLEITETALMMDVDKQITLIRKLKNYGFEIEIDDFGSGYSSLNTLKDIHADVLKIDMNFLQETKNQTRSWSILTSIMELSSSIGMNTITEGVETKEQLDNLVRIGCKTFQGYYFSKPLPVDEFENAYL